MDAHLPAEASSQEGGECSIEQTQDNFDALCAVRKMGASAGEAWFASVLRVPPPHPPAAGDERSAGAGPLGALASAGALSALGGILQGARGRIQILSGFAALASVVAASANWPVWTSLLGCAFNVIAVLLATAPTHDEQQALADLRCERDKLAAKVATLEKIQGERQRKSEAKIKRLKNELSELRSRLRTTPEDRVPPADEHDLPDGANGGRTRGLRQWTGESFVAALDTVRSHSQGAARRTDPTHTVENGHDAGCKSQ